MKKNNINEVLKPKTNGSSMKRKGINNQPPRNIITVKTLINMMEPYSVKKKRAKPILAYSTLKPDTNSDSASGRSNGARLVSAKMETNHIKNSGKRGMIKNM